MVLIMNKYKGKSKIMLLLQGIACVASIVATILGVDGFCSLLAFFAVTLIIVVIFYFIIPLIKILKGDEDIDEYYDEFD